MPIYEHNQARMGLLEGMDLLADAVACTLGPRGRNVAMPQKANLYGADYGDPAAPDAPVLVTNDGVSIAKSISLPDALPNMGAQLLKEAAIRANDAAGDGTTTAIVLARAVLASAMRVIAAGADPLAVRRGVVAAGECARAALVEAAIPVQTQDEIARVATISCQDEALGRLIGQAVFEVGPEGVVNVDDSRRLETTLDIATGIVLDRGFLSPHMATDAQQSTAELFNPYILITDQKLTSRDDLIPALMCAAEDDRPCLVVCDGIEGDALALVLGSRREADLTVVCVQAPGYGEGRHWRLEDLAVQTGGVFVTKDFGLSLEDVTRAHLGAAERVRCTARETVIEGAAGDPEAVARRVAELRNLVESTEYEFNRARHAERLAAFVSGIATIRVGGATEPEQWERKMRVEDAVAAARAAAAEGMLPGGGVALAQAAYQVRERADHVTGDEREGMLIAAEALEAPMRQIAQNAGLSGAYVVAHVSELPEGMGLDAARGEYVNMVEAGIVDPLRVTLGALNAAFSAAGTALLTEVGVSKAEQASEGSADAQ